MRNYSVLVEISFRIPIVEYLKLVLSMISRAFQSLKPIFNGIITVQRTNVKRYINITGELECRVEVSSRLELDSNIEKKREGERKAKKKEGKKEERKTEREREMKEKKIKITLQLLRN